jgi:hypothetical protein
MILQLIIPFGLSAHMCMHASIKLLCNLELLVVCPLSKQSELTIDRGLPEPPRSVELSFARGLPE